jgi:hypothetical protein
MIRKLAVAISLSILVSFFSVEAATNRGIHFDDTMTVGNEKLRLHGIGLLKWKYVINVYLVGFYKPELVAVDQALEDVPIILDYYFFVDMKASDFQDTGFQLMAQNVGLEKTKSLKPKLEQFNSFYRDVKGGQRYTFTYIPGQGIEMALDGEVLGQVKSDEFAVAYLSIWLGPNPVSKGLQEGMFDPKSKMQ